jgi:hypothetical protein
MTIGTAKSEPPPSFPNFDVFTSVDNAEYTKQQHWGNTVYFEAPNGITCSLSAYFLMSCTGIPFAVPGSDPAGEPNSCSRVEATVTPSRETGNTYRFVRSSDCRPPTSDVFRPLPGGSKVSLDVDGSALFTCAVNADLVACIHHEEDHGFVIEPSGSWTF